MFYLAKWVKTQDEQGWVVRPDVEVGAAYAALDLRGSYDAEAGIVDGAIPWCLLWTPDHLTPIRGRLIRFGDSPDDKSSAVLTQLRNRLAWNPYGRGGPMSALTLGQLAFDFYHETADNAEPGRPNRLYPTSAGKFEVVIGPHLMDSQPIPRAVGASVSDAFNRANETPLAAPWLSSTTHKPILVSNRVESGATPYNANYAFYNLQMASDAMWAEVEIAFVTPTNNNYNQWGACVRGLNTNANSSSYMTYMSGDGHRRIRLTTDASVGTPARTDITVSTGHSNVAGVVGRCTVDGTNLTASFNGVVDTGLSISNPTYGPSATRRLTGIYLYTWEEKHALDNFAGADVSAATNQTIALETIAGGVEFEPTPISPIALINSATTTGTSSPLNNVTLPTGYVTDDLFIAQIITREDDPLPVHGITTSAVSWTQIGTTQFLDLGTTGIAQSLWYRWATSSSETAPVATCPTPLTMSVSVSAFRNVDMTTPFDGVAVQGGTAAAANTLQGQTGSITPATSGAVALSFVSSADANDLSLSVANGFTLAYSQQVT